MIFSSLYGTKLDREVGTDDTVLFTVARRKQAINDGQAEFARLTECCQRRVTVSMAGGTSEYDLNSTTIIPTGDFTNFSKEDVYVTYTDASSNVTILEGDQLPRRDVHWLNRYRPTWQLSTTASTTAQLPDLYYVRSDGPAYFLGFTPQPGIGSSATMTFTLPYLADPPALASDTSEPFTFNSSIRTDLRPMHYALVHYAASQLEKFRRDDQASDRQLQKFMGYVTRYLQNQRIKGGRTIQTARSYFNKRVGGGASR